MEELPIGFAAVATEINGHALHVFRVRSCPRAYRVRLPKNGGSTRESAGPLSKLQHRPDHVLPADNSYETVVMLYRITPVFRVDKQLRNIQQIRTGVD